MLLLMGSAGFGQQVYVSGRVTDATTGEVVNFATVAVKGTSIGTNTNFDGVYHLAFNRLKDSITFSCVGYFSKSIYISKAAEQIIDVILQPSTGVLREVKIGANGYVNPAWAILTEVVKHKPDNDPDKILAYQYESYSRIEIDADHLSPKMLQQSFIGKALSMADSLKVTNADHIPVLPLFLSEIISNFYEQRNPSAKREDVLKTKTKGIGFEDGTLLAQLTGSAFQQYNFYRNFVSAAGKDFVSPLNDSWKTWYDYELENSEIVLNGVHCYQISFRPKRPQDLAFTGTIWIAIGNYALYQIKATVAPEANLNFIHQISLQQQMDAADPGRAWLPKKTRILVEVAQLSNNSSGLLAKSYTVHKNIKVNQAFPHGFFKENFTIADGAAKTDDRYWDQNRPDSLPAADKAVYHLIDTIKTIPTVKNYLATADLLINGYYRDGNLSFGPILNTYSYNNVEGNRLRFGFKTNSSFDTKWVLGGYLAYGTLDRAVKYGLSADYILLRKNWTETGISYSHDLNQVALLSDAYLYQRNNLFAAFTRFGRISRRKVFDQNLLTAYIKRDIVKGVTEKISALNWTFDPRFPFSYQATNGSNHQQLVVSELQLETRWAPGEQPLLSETINRPVSLKNNVSIPVFIFRYTRGFKNVLGGDINYQKFTVNVTQTLKMGGLGRGRYSLSAGIIPSSVPFPLLENHLGNETFIYNPNSFNLMRFFEFASDKYASINYTQHFEGLLLNSLPGIKDLKWRLVATTNILYGGLSASNIYNIQNDKSMFLKGLGHSPYVEAGYGVENIFKFIRVDFIHRLTYRDNHNNYNNQPKNFGVKVSAQLRL